MDIGKSLSFIFEDSKWIEKLLIGGLITLVAVVFSWTIIVGILGAALLLGYMVELVRNVRKDDPSPLPAWDEWSKKIALGIKLFVLYVIWALPLIIVSVPFGIIIGMSGDSDASGIFGLCLNCLAFLYGIFLFLAYPAITIRFAETEEISSGLEFGKIWEFTRANLSDIIIAAIVIWLVSMVAAFVGLLLCGIGIFFTGFWATLVQGHLYGQIGRKQESTSLAPSGYDLSPDDVMPGVGELTDTVKSGADEAVVAVGEIADSSVDVASDAADDVSDAAEEWVAGDSNA